jgi:hypothetical protein
MLAALAASGQQPSVFARARGFPPHRVSYWRARLGGPGAQAPRPDGGFVAVTVRGEVPAAGLPTSAGAMQAAAPPSRWEPRLEVTLGNGRRIAFAGTWDAAAIGPWLRALEGA